MKGRIAVLSAIVALLVVIGVPIWWQLTTVYRTTLPIPQIRQFINHTDNSVSDWDVRLNIYLVSPVSYDSSIREVVKSQNTKLSSLRVNTQISLNILPYNEWMGIDWRQTELVDQALLAWTGNQNEGNYSFFVILEDSAQHVDQFVFGQYRHGWVISSHTDQEHLKHVLFPALLSAFHSALTTSTDSKERMMKVELSPSYHLSYSLCNANPSLISGWQFSELRTYLSPFIHKLSVLSNITVDSQVVHYTHLDHPPRLSSNHSYILRDHLPYFINSNSWNLDFVADNWPVLNFVVFVPRTEHTPLYLKTENDSLSSSNGWIVPQWGGLVIWNPTEGRQVKLLRLEEMKNTLGAFVEMTRQLFGIVDSDTRSAIINTKLEKIFGEKPFKVVMLKSSSGITDWELDQVVIENLLEFQLKTRKTLLQFIDLVNNFPIIPIRDKIAEMLDNTLHNLKMSYKDGQFKFLSLVHARNAYAEAEETYFDSEMLYLIYFQDELKIAVYFPLILPFLLPLQRVIRNEIKKYLQKKALQIPLHKPTFLFSPSTPPLIKPTQKL